MGSGGGSPQLLFGQLWSGQLLFERLLLGQPLRGLRPPVLPAVSEQGWIVGADAAGPQPSHLGS